MPLIWHYCGRVSFVSSLALAQRVCFFVMVAVCVFRLGGLAVAAERYVDNGNGTISDTKTGLMWSKLDVRLKDIKAALKLKGDGVAIQDINRYVKSLDTGGHKDWRLPGYEEFDTIDNASNPYQAFVYRCGSYLAFSSDMTRRTIYSHNSSDVGFRVVRGQITVK